MLLLTILTLLASTALAFSGDMTWYTGLTDSSLGQGHCSLSTYTVPAGLYGMVIPTGIYANSAMCGACAAVTYNGKTIQTIVSCSFPDPYNSVLVGEGVPSRCPCPGFKLTIIFPGR